MLIGMIVPQLPSCASAGSAPRIDVPEFEALRDDELAAQHAPQLIGGSDYGDPEALLYRMSRDSDGNLHIAYHFVWPFERNDTSGCSPFLSRNIYTGGLGLQQTMFGPKDIEVVVLTIDPRGRIIGLHYETAENYDPSAFGVKHKKIEVRAKDGAELRGPFAFEVISWNHLFALREDVSAAQAATLINLTPVYFTDDLWAKYGMYKEETGFFSRHRAHLEWERESVE